MARVLQQCPRETDNRYIAWCWNPKSDDNSCPELALCMCIQSSISSSPVDYSAEVYLHTCSPSSVALLLTKSCSRDDLRRFSDMVNVQCALPRLDLILCLSTEFHLTMARFCDGRRMRRVFFFLSETVKP